MWIFYVLDHVICEKKWFYFLLSNNMAFISISCLLPLATIPRTILYSRSGNWYLCLDLREKGNHPPFIMMLAVGSLPSLLSVLIMKGHRLLSIVSSESIEIDHNVSFSFVLLMWCITYIYICVCVCLCVCVCVLYIYSYTEPPLNSWHKPHLVIMDNFSIYCWFGLLVFSWGFCIYSHKAFWYAMFLFIFILLYNQKSTGSWVRKCSILLFFFAGGRIEKD